MNPTPATWLPREPVAVIGMACRLPGAANLVDYWSLLIEGRDAVTEVPDDRWDPDRYYDPRPATEGRTNSRWGGFLSGVDQFDPDFFGISPREAAEMDPQQRLALEVAWEALEDSGHAPDGLAGSDTGVYLGVGNSDYSRLRFRHRETLNAYSGTGTSYSIVANRISYLLDLRGPSLTVDTACSASLVAVHLAVQSLVTGESDLVLAGGVNVILDPDVYVAFSQARYLSPDGRCKPFDFRANGYARGEGCGVVVLKRLADAVADRDRVLAVLLGSAVNQDGHSNGLNAPNPHAQQQVIRKAVQAAGVRSCDIGYVETHGTGTVLGDPIEIKSLAAVLGEGRTAHGQCLLGAVKANIGHLEAAAGIASFIKVVLVLNHRTVPPNRHLQSPNPELRLDESPFEIPTGPQDWPASEQPLAAVSSFGFGGTNAHMILGPAPELEPVAPVGQNARPEHVLCLSAHSERLLRMLCGEYARHVRAASLPVADVAYTANTGRARFPYRAAVRAGSGNELASRLEELAAGAELETAVLARARARPPRIGFLFSGHGSHHPGSGRQLYQTQPSFQHVVDHCEDQVRGRLSGSPRGFILGRVGSGDLALELTAQFVLEYALATLLLRWGIRPHTVMGHSLGEYAAACVAGVLDVEDALILVTTRGRLLAGLPATGAMAVAFDDESAVRKCLASDQEVSIAAVNGPTSTVLSGPRGALEQVTHQLERHGIETRRLRIPVAGHSPLLDPILDEFERVAAELRFNAPKLSFVSNVLGGALSPGEVPDARYWRRHLREPVRFAEGIRAMVEMGCDTFIELGPEPSMLAMGKACVPGSQFAWYPTLRRDQPDWSVLLQAIAEIYVGGTPVDWRAFDDDFPRMRVPMPGPAYERRRLWFEASQEATGAPQAPAHPLLGRRRQGGSR